MTGNRIAVLVTVILFAACLVFAGGGKEAPAAEGAAAQEVTLSMWMQDWPGGIAFVGAFNEYFTDKHPNVKIEWTLIGWADLGQKIIPAVIAKEEPDIIFGYSEWFIGQDVSSLFLKLTPDAFSKDELAKNIYPEAYNNVSSIMGKDGNVYGVPWRMGPDFDMVTVNMEMAAKAGVDITKVKSWDDILAVSKKMTQYNADGSIKVSGCSLDNYWTLCQGYITMVRQLGGNPFDAATGAWNFNSPAGLKAIEILDRFVEQKIWDPSSGSALDAFTKGLCASFFIGPWYSTYALGTYPNMKIDLYQVPALNNNPINLVPSIQMMAFSKRVTGAKRDAVFAYAKDLIGPTFMELYAKNDPGIGVILNKVFVENYKAGKYEGVWPDKTAATLIQRSADETAGYIPVIKPIPHNTTFDQWAQIMTPEFQKVFLQNGSYEAFVKAISDGLTKAEKEKRL
jgi:ABC-type glycerol-3-phosphate transport system substrate-binding protein